MELAPLSRSTSPPLSQFGVVDPLLIEPTDLLRGFVDFAGDERLGGVAVRGSDIETLVIVGARGSGRTTYLHRARLLAMQKPNVIPLPVENENIPQTDVVLRICSWYPPSGLVRRLQAIWRAAILRTLVYRCLRDPRLEDALGEMGSAGRQEFWETYEPLFGPDPGDDDERFHLSSSVYAQLTMIASECDSAAELDGLVLSGLWDALEERLAVALELVPTIIFYIDAFDQEYRHAPQQWTAWEKALFYQLFHFARAPGLAEQMRVVATVRDTTYSSVRSGDSASKYPPNGSNIRVLAWTPAVAKAFVNAQIARLAEPWLMKPWAKPSLGSWLGLTTIYNTRLGTEEDLFDYLLSHTRSLPRDLVSLGNALCDLVLDAKAAGDDHVAPDEVRRLVSETAFVCGREQLATAAADAASLLRDVDEDLVPPEMDHQVPDPDGHHLHFGSFQRALADRIEAIIGGVGSQHFRSEDFRFAQESVGGPSREMDLLSVLWRNGLVGAWQHTDRGDQSLFYEAGKWDRLTVPPQATHFCFHRSLIDVVDLAPGWGPDEKDGGLYIETSSAPAEVFARGVGGLDVCHEAFVALEWLSEAMTAYSRLPVAADRAATRAPLTLESIVIRSPGFALFNGGNVRELRKFLNDREKRRVAREIELPAVKRQQYLEEQLLALEVVEKVIDVGRRAGIPQDEIVTFVRTTVFAGLGAGVENAERVFDLGSARLIGPGDDRDVDADVVR